MKIAEGVSLATKREDGVSPLALLQVVGCSWSTGRQLCQGGRGWVMRD